MPHSPDHCKACRTAAPEPGRTRCATCAAKRNAADAVRRAELRAGGKCLTCGKRALKGRAYCAIHRDYYRERARRAGA